MGRYKIPEDLYQYQKEDLERLLNTKINFLNLSEMGTGKTPTAIGLAMQGNFHKTLVVCPNSLKFEWKRQILEWTELEHVSIARKSCYRRLETLFEKVNGKEDPFFIINYESFRSERHLEILNLFPFDLLILDEVHRLRNPSTKQTKGMKSFLEVHPHCRVVGMTGSPIVNNPADLHTVLSLLYPEQYSPKARMDFINRYCFWAPGVYGIQILGPRNLDILREQTKSFTIRHTKKEVLSQLPDKYYRKVILEMGEEQREVYRQMEEELFALLDEGEPIYATSVLAKLLRLRQINLEPHILGISNSSSSKTEFIEDLIEDMSDKLVVFSCFETYISYISSRIKVPHIVITGKVPVEERSGLVKRFQEDPSIRLCLGTVQTMGEGLTLTAASNVVFADRWWNPAVNVQAEDRLHRIGQKGSVRVIIPVNDRSVDSSLDRILEAKASYSKAYLGDSAVIREVIEDLRSGRS